MINTVLNHKKPFIFIVFSLFWSQLLLAQINFNDIAIPETGCNYKVFPSDVDGDGDMDYFAICYSAMEELNHLTWYENKDGQGNFSKTNEISTNDEIPTRIFPCDIDGDGDQDLLSGTRGKDGMNKKMIWFKNTDGLGNFGGPQIIDITDETVWSLQAADIDNDGDLDIIAAINEDRIVWYENINGLGSFGPAQIISKLFSDVYDIHVSDADSDGDLDVYAAFTQVVDPNSTDNRLVWYENVTGEGDFGEEILITQNINVPSALNTADFDGDGDLDVISCSLRGGKIAWFENSNGLGDFSIEHIILEDDLGLSDLAIADIDKDGDMDVFSTTREWESSNENKVSWYENESGLGDFSEQKVISSDLSIPASIALADFDGDQDLDVICKSGSYSTNSATTYWFENLSVVGINQFTFENFIIYPTLTHDFIYIKSTQEIESITLYDVIGNEMLYERTPDQIDVSMLSNGTYFCLLKDAKGNLGIQKILKTSY